MIKIADEPEGHLIRRGDILNWLPGLTLEQWKKIRPTLKAVKLPGCAKPYYRKAEIKTKIVNPILQEANT